MASLKQYSEKYKALQQARDQEKLAEFRRAYAQYTGTEGTVSAGVRTPEFRKAVTAGWAEYICNMQSAGPE